jgi:predicted TIM-barrel fold metal-dependent hydrolase
MTEQLNIAKHCCPPIDTHQPVLFDLPDNACDSHAHIFGPYEKYPLSDERSYTPPENDTRRFLRHLDRFGLRRGVLVTASACGTDNRSILDALEEYPDRLRGVAVCDQNTAFSTLRSWRATGVMGLRFNLYKLNGQAVYKNGVGLSALETLAPLMRELGMHAQIWVHAPDLPDLTPTLEKLKIPLVIDHMGRMNVTNGVANPGFQKLCELLADGVAWTKLSGADRISDQKGAYEDVDTFAESILKANSEQVVWGTDWPHINYFDSRNVPDDGVLLNALHRWIPDEQLRSQVLVDNPARLYRF